MLFFITGASASGKSACLPHLRELLPAAAAYEFDSVGVPPDADTAWRQRATEHWLQRALEHQAQGRDMVVCGGAILGEVLACPSAPQVEGIRFCLLDCHDVTRIDRIRQRGTGGWDTQDMLNWAAWQRLHVVDPQWRPDVIRQGGAEGMHWQRWASWQRDDPRWQAWVLDTTLLSVRQVAERVVAWVQAQGSDRWRRGDFWITDETSAVDVGFFAAALHSTYWADKRPRDVIEKSLKTSLVFSLFEHKRQIGFTRVVSDQATFAWLCDVYVHPDYRGRGLGKWLLECTLEHPATQVRINLLATRDAHGLYEQFGFEPKECMIRLRD